MPKNYNPQETIDIIRKFADVMAMATDRYQELYNVVGRCDRETSDLVHDIELSTFSAKEGNIKAVTLKKIRKERRAAKDEMEYIILIKQFMETIEYKTLLDDLDYMLTEMKAVKEKQEQRTYIPRERPVVLTSSSRVTIEEEFSHVDKTNKAVTTNEAAEYSAH